MNENKKESLFSPFEEAIDRIKNSPLALFLKKREENNSNILNAREVLLK